MSTSNHRLSRIVSAIAGLAAVLTPSAAVARSVQTARYIGKINGARADAVLSFEQMREYKLVSGQIKSGRFTYGFTSDVYGESGFGTMTDHSAGTRFQIKVVFSQGGFRLISNPLGPGTPSTYDFKLVR
jgi:uncharacterized protein (DUF433 family)